MARDDGTRWCLESMRTKGRECFYYSRYKLRIRPLEDTRAKDLEETKLRTPLMPHTTQEHNATVWSLKQSPT